MYYASTPSTSKAVDAQEPSNSDTDTAVSTCSSSSRTLSCDEASSATLSADEPIAESFQIRRSQLPCLSSSSSSSSSTFSSSCLPSSSSSLSSSSSSSLSSTENSSSLQTRNSAALVSTVINNQIVISSETDSASSTPTRKSAPLKTLPRHRTKSQSSNESSASSPALSHSETPGTSQRTGTFINNYQMFRDIRRQIEERHRSLFLVRPRAPHDFQNYLLCRKSYTLAGTVPSEPDIKYPPNLHSQMKELYKKQELERYKLRMQHIVEQEKLVLSIEQQILRAHARAARVLTDQNRPLSACTILKDKEVYSLNTPEQEKRERQAGLAYNNKLFVEWLKEIDDKSEQIKNQLISRQNFEAQSLHAVQRMDWELKLRELRKPIIIDPLHVPMV